MNLTGSASDLQQQQLTSHDCICGTHVCTSSHHSELSWSCNRVACRLSLAVALGSAGEWPYPVIRKRSVSHIIDLIESSKG